MTEIPSCSIKTRSSITHLFQDYLRLFRSTRRRFTRFGDFFFGERFFRDDFFFLPPVTTTVAGTGGAFMEAKMSMYPGPRASDRDGKMVGSIILFYIRIFLT